ncbi:AAA family ATPase [Emticicia soli]|uniref:AAA family ATPase n=1 Tax=Emticicia soli TaxID=2027878 RepID=A0ABW5J917_9BACT
MKLNNILITGVAGINNISINFNPQMNIICGPNGIGKTTILESIGHLFFRGPNRVLKRSANSSYGLINGEFSINNSREKIEIKFKDFKGIDSGYIENYSELAKFIISLKISRYFEYRELDSISKDYFKNPEQISEEASSGVKFFNVKNWIVRRFIFSAHENALTPSQAQNFEIVKKCFSIINNDFSFSRIDALTNDIMINTPNGEIYFEYLSAGYKSILSILFSVINEVEHRFDTSIVVEEFEGIILIDELELHLHPNWQEKIVKILIETFPKAQFFVTTHSPHIIQNALPNQIIALELRGKDVVQREIPNTEYGFQGWTIEEILTDIMGMKDTQTTLFNNKIKAFQNLIQKEDYQEALILYNELNILLHPHNELRELFKFQLISIKDKNND